MTSLIKIFNVLPPQEYKSCLMLFIIMLVGIILETIGVGAIFPLISALGDEEYLFRHSGIASIMGNMGIYGHSEFIICCSVALIVFYLLKNLFLTFVTDMQIRFVMRNQIFYSEQLLANYLSKPYLFHVNHNTGILLRNVNAGPATLFTMIVLPMLNFILECAMAVSIIVMVLFVEPFIAIAVCVFLGSLMAVITKSFRKRIARQGTVQKDYIGQFYSWANQSLGAVKETQVMHIESFFLKKCDAAYKRYSEAMRGFQLLSQVPRFLIESVAISGLLLLIILKLLMGNKTTDIVPLLGLLAVAAFRLMPSVNRIVSLYNSIKFQMPFFHEIYPEFMEIKKRVVDGASDVFLPDVTKIPFLQDICIEHVAFSYDYGREILRDICFQVRRGDFVGIVGPSGAGKTTFVDILLGLLPPTHGCILVDGVDISSNVRGWQANLAYVPQAIYLVDGSIKENIAIGRDSEDIDVDLLEKVLRMAELYEFIQSLPEGVNTMVGERGVKLSGGQRQRVGIARALYQKPEVLILDEATSALDNETEKSIVNTILKLKGKMTIISIAHRISTLEECDYKVRFLDGICEVI